MVHTSQVFDRLKRREREKSSSKATERSANLRAATKHTAAIRRRGLPWVYYRALGLLRAELDFHTDWRKRCHAPSDQYPAAGDVIKMADLVKPSEDLVDMNEGKYFCYFLIVSYFSISH